MISETRDILLMLDSQHEQLQSIQHPEYLQIPIFLNPYSFILQCHRAKSQHNVCNNNGVAADAGDSALMKEASIGKNTPNWRYDLNTNGIFVDAGDLAMTKDAAAGKIVLV